MNSPFPVRLRAAAIIPRWAIIHRIQQDYLSSHSFYVAIYARQIVELIDWSGDMGDLLTYALLHDLDELFTGDIVGPAKRNIIDGRLHSNFIGRKMNELTPSLIVSYNEDMRMIVKAADQLDALLYAIGEQVLGNGIIAARIPSCYDKLREAWFKLPCKGEKVDDEDWGTYPKPLGDLWLDVVVPAINEHRDPLRYDIGR